jgi:putative transposase
MTKPRHTDTQIMNILKQAEAGTPVSDLCREHGMSSASFYKWRSKYGGMDASLMTRMKELEAENNRLKKMYADVQLQNDVIKEAMASIQNKILRPVSR